MSTTSQSLPIGDSVSFGWETFKKWAALLVGLIIVVAFVEGAMEFIDEEFISQRYGDGTEFLWFIAVALVNATLELGMTNVTLKLRDTGRAEFADVFNIFDRVPFYIVSLFMVFIIVGPPDEVYLTDEKESWYYKNPGKNQIVVFNFLKIRNIFSDKHYTLIRDSQYKSFWYRSIDKWRKGVN